jgi:hypothetical protein
MIQAHAGAASLEMLHLQTVGRDWGPNSQYNKGVIRMPLTSLRESLVTASTRQGSSVEACEDGAVFASC